MADYVTEAEFRLLTKDDSTLDAAQIPVAITAASRAVEQMTNRPTDGFTLAASATAKYFSPDSATKCCLADDGIRWEFGSLTSLTVKLDTNGDGTYETTLTNGTHFYLEPINGARYGVSGWPYDELKALAASATTFPRAVDGYRPPVEVTAKWGWAATPATVKFATALAANRYYGRGGARYGTAGFDAAGFVMRIRQDPDIAALLEPFIPASRMVA